MGGFAKKPEGTKPVRDMVGARGASAGVGKRTLTEQLAPVEAKHAGAPARHAGAGHAGAGPAGAGRGDGVAEERREGHELGHVLGREGHELGHVLGREGHELGHVLGRDRRSASPGSEHGNATRELKHHGKHRVGRNQDDSNDDDDDGDEEDDGVAPWLVEIIGFRRDGERSNENAIVRESASRDAPEVGQLAVGTTVEVFDVTDDGSWYQVGPIGGPPQGWVVNYRVVYQSGPARGYPYVLADGRDGSRETALAWARSQLGNNSYYRADIDMTLCLAFVQDCFGIQQIHTVTPRCPALYQGGSHWEGDAKGALDMIASEGHMLSGSPPPGAILFFEWDFEKDGVIHHVGHVAIAGDGDEVISTGTRTNPAVHTTTLAELGAITDGYVGFTTPEVAFVPGSWGTADGVPG